MRLYRSCSDLPIYNFHKMMETGNYAYLTFKWDEHSEVKYNKEEVIKVWGGIYNEYCKITNNNKAIQFYRENQRLAFLHLKKEVGSRILTQIALREMKPKTLIGYIDALRNLGFKYEGNEKTHHKIKDLDRQLRAMNNQIELLSDSIEKMKSKGEAVPFSKEIVKVEQALGRNIVDPKITSTEKWVYLIEEIKELNEQRRKQLAKHGRK